MKKIKKHISLYLKLSFIFISLIQFSQFSFSQENIYLINDVNQKLNNLNNELLIFEDSNNKFSIKEIKNVDFKKYDSQKLNSKSTYWAKISIKSAIKEKADWIFYFADKRGSDISEIYVYDNDSLIKKTKSGQFEKKINKEIFRETGSKFLFSPNLNNTYTIFFKIKNISKFSAAFNLKLESTEVFNNKINQRNLEQGWLQGILWIMFFYNLFVFVYSRDKVYLFYALYILGIAFNFFIERGLFIEYIIPNSPILNPYIFIIATGLASAAYFQFIRLFIDTKIKMPKWDNAHKYVIWLNILISIILLIILKVIFNVRFAINVSNYLNLAGLFYGLIFIAYLIKKGDFLSRFFVTGALFLAIGTIISLYFLITKTDLNINPKIFMSAGTIGEILFFSLGLGYRIRLIEKEKQKTQIKLIEQLKNNESLKEKVNRELEQKVKERTIEIEQQNEEIIAQTENLIRANDVLINQKREIENKNEEITLQKSSLEKILKNTKDSINYASKIQEAILPPENILEAYFKDYFIYYKPKEIVSGDFYWHKFIKRDDGRYFIFVAGDATGHGVPGALVSMLGISFLNEVVARKDLKTANQVLEILRNEVKSTFRQTKENTTTRDGFDMAFCVLNLDTLEMQYAGANRPVLIIKNKNSETVEKLIEIKGDRNPIGIHPREKNFTNHIIQLEKGDKIYLFSDGFSDQLGGFDGRKFYLKRFKDLLCDITNEPMKKQKALLDEKYQNWISSDNQNFKQVDDILVMGLKI
ncbi:MAG: SpoIIE family protein phosphatase [Bacteroidales bacterium]|nr:SpoIIE family protein phosphatase [Bacteroidales bacterium]